MDILQKRMRHRQFWQPPFKGEGAYLGVMSPINDSGVLPRKLEAPKNLEEQWISTEYCVQRAEASLANTYWGQDAIPSVFVNMGPGVQAALLGATYVMKKESIWYDTAPPIKSWDSFPAFVTNRGHELYKAIESQTRALCAASKGRFEVSFTDIGGQMDTLVALRGEELFCDFIEYPDAVLAAEARIDDEFIAYFNTLRDIIGPAGYGYTGWLPLVCDVPWFPLQCDMCVMISPEMFERFVLPSLDKVSSAIGQSLYHLDGPGEIRHLDMILSLPHIHAIQWVPVRNVQAGGSGGFYQDFTSRESIEVCRRVLAAGKKLMLECIRPGQIPAVLDAIGCDGVYIHTQCDTRAEADELIDAARKKWLRL